MSPVVIAEHYTKQLDNVIIIRPGVIIGGGDIFMKRLLPIFKASFFVPLFGDGSTKFQPVFIDDVSLAVDKIINSKIDGKNIYELAGPRIYSYKEFFNHISNLFVCIILYLHRS